MNFLKFPLFLILSNAEFLPLNLDGSDLLSTDSPLPGLSSLNLPALGNDPSPFNLFLAAGDSNSDPTFSYSAEPAGAGDGGESLAVLPSTTFAEAQTKTDDFNGLCNSGQNRRKRQLNFCRNQGMLEFYPNVPLKPQANTPQKEKETDDMARKDEEWMIDQLKKRLGSRWREMTASELEGHFLDFSLSGDDSCAKQPAQKGGYVRPHTLCCLGPIQFMTLPSSQLRLIRRQDPVVVADWFNCQFGVPGRPFCGFRLDGDWGSNSVCCRDWSIGSTSDAYTSSPDWWRYGFKGLDCVDHLA